MKKRLFLLPGIEPRLLVCPGCRPVALQTELGLQDVSGLELEQDKGEPRVEALFRVPY